MPEVFICSQCGSTSYDDLTSKRIQCSHCGTVYKKYAGRPAVIVEKGANISIGKTGNVEIRGNLEIQDGAKIDIQGQVVIEDRNNKAETESNYIKDHKRGKGD